MDNHLNRHTYGFIQSRLVPFYLHLGSACAFFNLTIYAVYHPSDMLDDREAFQVCSWYKLILCKTSYVCNYGSMNSRSLFNLWQKNVLSPRSSSSLCLWQWQLSTPSGLARWHQRSWQTCILSSRCVGWARISACRPIERLMPSCARRTLNTDTSVVVCGCTDSCHLFVTFVV